MRRIMVCALLVLGACSTAPIGQPLTSVQPVQTEYRIHPGDVLDLKFFYNPELNETVLVRPDGRISVQLANEVVAAGLTPEDLRKNLIERYGHEINKPELAVIVRSFSMQRVYVDGEVFRPGMLPLSGPVTLQQAIAAAGGFLPTAKRTDVIIIRQAEGSRVSYKVDMEEALKDDSPAVFLAPFDIVYVPRSAVGEVNKFVDLYIRRNLPIGAGVGFGWTVGP
jgi:protein involved in polysaccharide export with SLBB domain